MSSAWVENNRIAEKKVRSLIECGQELLYSPAGKSKHNQSLWLALMSSSGCVFMALCLCAVLRPSRSWRRTRSLRGESGLCVQTPGASRGHLCLLPDGEHLLHYHPLTASPPSRWCECFPCLLSVPVPHDPIVSWFPDLCSQEESEVHHCDHGRVLQMYQRERQDNHSSSQADLVRKLLMNKLILMES